MATKQSIADFIAGQLAGSGVSARKMFGEYGLFFEGKMAAVICDDQLYVKKTEAGFAFLGSCPEGEPYPRAKPHFLIDAERWDDEEWLTKLILLTAEALPVPAKRPRKPR
jgi:TfoX/Sxy family transcriptional regulator of competence genes